MRFPTFALLLASAALVAACSEPEPPQAPVRAARTWVVAADSAGGRYEYAAEVRAQTESRLGFRVGGKIVRRDVGLGDAVRAGQTLARLDPQDLQLGQEAARATLLAAKVNADQAEADLGRFRELRDQGFISSAELERRETALKSARAQYEQARAQSQVQGNQAGYAALVADAPGVITGVEAEPGMVVAAGTPVVRLAHDGPRDVVFAVPEDKVALIKSLAGQPERFRVRLWGGGEEIPVTLREIAAAADPATRTFTVKADLGRTAAARAVQLGQTATVILDLPPVQGAIKLPLSALRESGGQTTVWVVNPADMTVSSRVVVLAGADGNEALLEGGLSPGERVVTAGVHVLEAGQVVKLYADRPEVAAK